LLLGLGVVLGHDVDDCRDNHRHQQNFRKGVAQAPAAKAEAVKHLIEEADTQEAENKDSEEFFHDTLSCNAD